MNRAYSDIIKHSAIYGLGLIATRLASLILLPVYTRYLTPNEYGIIALLDLGVSILAIMIAAGIGAAAERYHFQAKECDRACIWWTGMTYMIAAATIGILPLLVFSESVGRVLLGSDLKVDEANLVAFALITLWFSLPNELSQRHLRVCKRSKLLVALSLVHLGINITLNMLLLIVFKMGVGGVLLGNLLTSCVMVLLRMPLFAKLVGKFSFDLPVLRKLVRFGIPLIFMGLLVAAMQQADRYFLRLFSDLREVGLYSLAFKLVGAVNTLIILPFSSIWSTVAYEVAEMPDAKKVYAQIFQFFIYALTLLLLVLAFAAEPLLRVLTTGEFADAAALVPVGCLAFVFYGMHIHFRVPAFLSKKTERLILAPLLAVIISVLLNCLVIPRFGAFGAAWVAVASFATYSFVGLFFYRRIDRIDYPLFRVCVVLAGVVASYCVFLTIKLYTSSALLTYISAAAISLFWALCLFGPIVPQILRQAKSTRLEGSLLAK